MDPTELQRHIKFLKAHLMYMPTEYESHSNNSLMFLFFTVSGMDVLNASEIISGNLRSAICDKVYCCQNEMEDPDTKLPIASFKGTSLLTIKPPQEVAKTNERYTQCGEIAMTYMALLILLILGDDLSRLRREALIRMIKKTQLSSGCFSVSPFELDTDMRFCYCAIASCAILDCFDAINMPQLFFYIESCFVSAITIRIISSKLFYYRIMMISNLGGSTFCAVASVYIVQQHCPTHSKNATQLLDSIRGPCLRWAVHRAHHHTLGGGYNGRPSKIADTCYSFWTGGTIHILYKSFNRHPINVCSAPLIDVHSIRHHSLSAQDLQRGGFAKHPDSRHSDILHTYFGICGWSMLNVDPSLKTIEPSFMISLAAYLKFIEKNSS